MSNVIAIPILNLKKIQTASNMDLCRWAFPPKNTTLTDGRLRVEMVKDYFVRIAKELSLPFNEITKTEIQNMYYSLSDNSYTHLRVQLIPLAITNLTSQKDKNQLELDLARRVL